MKKDEKPFETKLYIEDETRHRKTRRRSRKIHPQTTPLPRCLNEKVSSQEKMYDQRDIDDYEELRSRMLSSCTVVEGYSEYMKDFDDTDFDFTISHSSFESEASGSLSSFEEVSLTQYLSNVSENTSYESGEPEDKQFELEYRQRLSPSPSSDSIHSCPGFEAFKYQSQLLRKSMSDPMLYKTSYKQ